MSADPIPHDQPTLEQTLDHARRAIEIDQAEIDEAKDRRAAVADALCAEFPGCRVYFNGSIAHGDALTPLTDVDLGVVVPDPEGTYGPGRRGPHDLQVRAAHAIRAELKGTYGDLAVEVEGRKRSILVWFRDPVAPGRPDFTADVIVAVDNADEPGLYIPRWTSWDRSDPEKHTELVLTAIKATDVAYARVVRLVKHWSRQHDKPLCSWQIKALALGCLTVPTALVPGLLAWFRCAADQLTLEDTPDPAGVSKPIETPIARTEVVRMLRDAADRLDRAIGLERAGYPTLALDELAGLFDDETMLPRPDQVTVMVEENARLDAEKNRNSKTVGAPALLTGVGAGALDPRPNVRSWAP